MVATKAPILVVEGLTKRFGDLFALREVSFALEPGEVFGLLGPNGAGKTTLLRLVVGLLKPTQGRVLLLGRPLGASRRGEVDLRKRLGWVPQISSLDPLLTGKEFLLLSARLYEVEEAEAKVEATLRRFGLSEAKDRLVKAYSGGMRKRLEIAAATLHDPDLLILDEPTVGLDVQARHDLWDLIRALAAEGRTVLLTTHYLDEADTLCQRVAILDRGRLMALDTPLALKRRYGTYHLRLSYAREEEARAARQALERLGFRAAGAEGTHLEIDLQDPWPDLERVRAAIPRLLPEPLALDLRAPSLDQVFARVTGRAFDPVTGTPLDQGPGKPQAALERDENPRLQGADSEVSRVHASPGSDEQGASLERGWDTAGQALGPPGSGTLSQGHPQPALRRFLRHTGAFFTRWLWRVRRDTLNQAMNLLQPLFWLALFGGIWSGVDLPFAEGGYLAFVTAGAVTLTVFNTALMGGLEIMVDREWGTLDRFLVSPAPPMALVASRYLFVTLFATLQSLLTLALAGLLGVAIPLMALPALLFLLALLAASVSAFSIYLTFRLPYHGHFYTVTGLLALPMVLLSSAFVPLSAMPPLYRALAQLNPLTHAVEGARSLLKGSGVSGEVLLTLLLFNLLTLLLAYRSARREVG